MRKTVLISLLIAMAGFVLAAATVQDEVMQAEKAWAAAVMKGDHATLDKLLADGLIYTHSSALVEDKAAYFGKLKAGTLKYESLTHESMTVRAYGNSAILHARARMKGVSDGKPFDTHAVMTHVWVKQGGMWRLAAHQATRLP